MQGFQMAIQIDERSNGQMVEVSVSEVLRIALEENPTTGFRWVLERNGEPVCVLIKDFFETAVSATGQGGRHYWEFRTENVGEETIELAYRRSWEKATPARTFRLSIRTRD